MGRNSIKSDRVVRKLEKAFEDGLNVVEACTLSGISRDTYYRWLNMDETFSDKMRRAQLSLTSRAKSVIAKAINKGDIKAAKWYLEKEFKKNSRQTTNHRERVETEQSPISPEEAKRMETLFNESLVNMMDDYVATDESRQILNNDEIASYALLEFEDKLKVAMKYAEHIPMFIQIVDEMNKNRAHKQHQRLLTA